MGTGTAVGTHQCVCVYKPHIQILPLALIVVAVTTKIQWVSFAEKSYCEHERRKESGHTPAVIIALLLRLLLVARVGWLVVRISTTPLASPLLLHCLWCLLLRLLLTSPLLCRLLLGAPLLRLLLTAPLLLLVGVPLRVRVTVPIATVSLLLLPVAVGGLLVVRLALPIARLFTPRTLALVATDLLAIRTNYGLRSSRLAI